MGGIVTTCAGGFGRFGNAMFQYAVARAYAESIGAELRVGNWIGRDLFEGVNDKSSEGLNLPNIQDEKLDGVTDVHLHGYFQREEHVALLSRKKLKEWFKPRPQWVRKGFDLIFHKRRGDYIGNGYYAVVSDKSYDDAAHKFGYDPAKAEVFSDGRDQNLIYDDFFNLAASRVLFRANSSFSFWAGVLCDGIVYSPVVEDRTGDIDCEFVKGNYPKLMQMFKDLHIKD